MKFDYSFPKQEKLAHQKLFDAIFKNGNRAFEYPFLALWSEVSIAENVSVQAGFSVPKKHFKKAHDRNRIKRWLREAFRTENAELKKVLTHKNTQIAVIFITVKSDNISFDLVQPKIKLLLTKITEQVSNAE